MKKSVIYLGIALLTITNVISALAQQSFIKEESLAQTGSSKTSLVGNIHRNPSIEKRNTNDDKNQASIDLEIITAATYQKTMEEIIAENNQIIESTMAPEQYTEESVVEENQLNFTIDASPVTNEKTIEETILQDSQIIESPVLNAVQPITLRKSKKS